MRMKVKSPKYVFKEENTHDSEWRDYMMTLVKQMSEDNISFPALKNISGVGHRFQIYGHSHLADSLQGYWERHNKEYIHRARCEYRALYLGHALQLAEEQHMNGKSNSRDLAILEVFCQQKSVKHEVRKMMALARSEILNLLHELESGIIDQEMYDAEVQEIINLFSNEEQRIRMSEIIDYAQDDILKKSKHAKATRKWRSKQKQAEAGLTVISPESDT